MLQSAENLDFTIEIHADLLQVLLEIRDLTDLVACRAAQRGQRARWRWNRMHNLAVDLIDKEWAIIAELTALRCLLAGAGG